MKNKPTEPDAVGLRACDYIEREMEKEGDWFGIEIKHMASFAAAETAAVLERLRGGVEAMPDVTMFDKPIVTKADVLELIDGDLPQVIVNRKERMQVDVLFHTQASYANETSGLADEIKHELEESGEWERLPDGKYRPIDLLAEEILESKNDQTS